MRSLMNDDSGIIGIILLLIGLIIVIALIGVFMELLMIALIAIGLIIAASLTYKFLPPPYKYAVPLIFIIVMIVFIVLYYFGYLEFMGL